jgi:hypothetical protein
MARTVRAPSMLHSSAAYSRKVPVRRATEKVSVYWDDDEERIVEEGMFVGSRSDIYIEGNKPWE